MTGQIRAGDRVRIPLLADRGIVIEVNASTGLAEIASPRGGRGDSPFLSVHVSLLRRIDDDTAHDPNDDVSTPTHAELTEAIETLRITAIKFGKSWDVITPIEPVANAMHAAERRAHGLIGRMFHDNH